MYKQVMLLGLLMEMPMYGQQIREVIERHHDLFADFIKKPTIYYQLERLVHDGYLEMRREVVEAPGPGAAHTDLALRERDIYYITEAGREHFSHLLRNELSSYSPALSNVDACLFFLHYVKPEEAITLLTDRYTIVMNHRQQVLLQIEKQQLHDSAHQLVNDHKLTLLDAELRWLERTIEHLRISHVVSLQENT